MSDKFIGSNPANYSIGREGLSITMGIFHRTAISGDSALGEATYSHNNIVKASYYKVIDLDGNIVQSTIPSVTEWNSDEWPINLRTLAYEFTGPNGSALTVKQISAVIEDIKLDPATKTIKPVRLSLPEILSLKASGWFNHLDVTKAFNIPGGHVDAISEAEITQILNGIR